MVGVRAADWKSDSAVLDTPGLALDARESPVVVDHEVATVVLAEWQKELDSRGLQREHDGERGSVADRFRVRHVARIANASAGPWP
jgi:hypothetical protein